MANKHTPGPWKADVTWWIDQATGQPTNNPGYHFSMSRNPTQWEVTGNHKIMEAALDLLIAAKGAVAALSQNKTHPADIAAAKKWLNDAITKAERENDAKQA